MEFDEVRPEHFSSISRTPFPHVLIDRALQEIAGSNKDPALFRKEALAAAGWKYDGLTPFGKFPAEACVAFNRLREVLAHTEEADAVLAELAKQEKLAR